MLISTQHLCKKTIHNLRDLDFYESPQIFQNQKIETRNTQRQGLVGKTVQRKLDYAKQFAMQTIVGKDNLAYTTETDLVDQEIANRDKIDEEWRKRLESS